MSFSYKNRAPRVLRVAANSRGRDFIVGDIHGAYNSVVAAMRAANFDYSRDRIFSVGDLIDRGLDSWRCAQFLAKRYTFACRGNHEDILLELYRDGTPHQKVLEWAARNHGFGWWLDTPEEKRQQILSAIAELPTIIELETPRGLVGLVHADIPSGMDWGTFVQKVEAEDATVLETALWGRVRIRTEDETGVAGIGRIFVGHSILWNGLRKLGNVYAVDTGAIFGETGVKKEGRLTFVNAMMRTAVLTEQRPATLIDIRDHMPGDIPTNPFGMYARS